MRWSFWGSSGQGIKEAGFCWKLCTLAKTRWKDQAGLYELAPSFFSGSDFPQHASQGWAIRPNTGYQSRLIAQGNDMGPYFQPGLGFEAGAGWGQGLKAQV